MVAVRSSAEVFFSQTTVTLLLGTSAVTLSHGWEAVAVKLAASVVTVRVCVPPSLLKLRLVEETEKELTFVGSPPPTLKRASVKAMSSF